MDTQNKNRIRPTFSLSHFLTFSGFSGFTLVEVLVTLAIIGFIGSVSGTVYYQTLRAEMGYEVTVEIMDTLKKAILGSNIPHNRGVHISGYVADMGALPPLNEDNQPMALWKKTSALVIKSRYYAEQRIRTGWNGPYIQKPEGGFLTDGWGNGLSFTCKADGGLTIKSYGADMKPGGVDLDEDITLKIEKYHYMAPLGLSFRGLKGDLLNSEFTINYPDPVSGALKSEGLEIEGFNVGELGFGRFVSDDNNKPLFPIGLRSITATIKHRSEKIDDKVIVFPIQPGMNYMGMID